MSAAATVFDPILTPQKGKQSSAMTIVNPMDHLNTAVLFSSAFQAIRADLECLDAIPAVLYVQDNRPCLLNIAIGSGQRCRKLPIQGTVQCSCCGSRRDTTRPRFGRCEHRLVREDKPRTRYAVLSGASLDDLSTKAGGLCLVEEVHKMDISPGCSTLGMARSGNRSDDYCLLIRPAQWSGQIGSRMYAVLPMLTRREQAITFTLMRVIGVGAGHPLQMLIRDYLSARPLCSTFSLDDPLLADGLQWPRVC